MKILFLQEYIRENHMKKAEDNTFKNIFFSTKGGTILRKLIEDGLGLQRNDYYIDYAYSMVPKVLTRDKYGKATKYKPPKQSEASAEYAYLYERILREKPDIIIPTGNLGCKALIGKSAITQVRGVPEKVTIKSNRVNDTPSSEKDTSHLNTLLERAEDELTSFQRAYGDRINSDKALMRDYNEIVESIDHYKNKIAQADNQGSDSYEAWVLPMYSMEYMLMNPSIQNLIEADFVTLKKFVDEGEAAFRAKAVNYEFVTDMNRVRQIFTQEIPAAPITAWDLETNTLHPELPGAKPLVVSLSWQEGTGVTIPLEHKEFSWNIMELHEIYELMKQFVGDPNIIKVGHNIKYDIRFLRLTKGFTKFANNRDTMTLYYLLVNQDVESSLRLSDLAYELTDMGGYDRPLEEFKEQYIKDFIAREKVRIEQMKEDHKRKVAEEKALAKAEGRKYVAEKRTFPKAEPPTNEVDGGDFNYEWIPLLAMLSPYASGDVDVCLRIYNKLDAIGSKPENTRLRALYTSHYPDLISVLAKIEANGVKMDKEYNEELTEAYIVEEERLVEELRKFPEVQQLELEHRTLYERGLAEWAIPKADRDLEVAKLRDKYKEKLKFNPNSPDDKKRLLFDILGITLPYNREYLIESAVEDNIPESEIEWFHYKTNKTALDYIKSNFEHAAPIAELLLTHSLVKTRKQGFTYKLRNMCDPEGFLHGGFNPTGTATTRLSSQSPNLQQLPRKTGDVYRFDYKYPIKRMFVTRFEGGALLQFDYSSLESRVLALAARDDEMTQAFLDGADIHKETASLVFGTPIDNVTDDQRSAAKSTTFGIAYGETPFSYYAKHGMTLKEAEKLFDDFFRNKPRIKNFIDETHGIVKSAGYVETLHGFRRNLRDVYSQDKSKQNEALRQSVNTKIQGSGAFLTNTSVIYLNKFIEENNLRSQLILTVHDSIVIDCPPEEIHLMAKAGLYIMENLPIDWLIIDWKGEKLRYPIKADIEIGVTYNDMVDYDVEELNSFHTVKNYCKYQLDLKKIKNYKESKVITEEKAEELQAAIKSKKAIYQTAS